MNDPTEDANATANDVEVCAKQFGVDLHAVRDEFAFQSDTRFIVFWRIAYSPRTNVENQKEVGEVICYSLQGPLTTASANLSGDCERTEWCESGVLEGVHEAFKLTYAWLIERLDVDELPSRRIRRHHVLK